MTTQSAMIQAASSIAAMLPPAPSKSILASRHDQLVYSVFKAAAQAAYLRAAQECVTAAYDAAGGGIDLEATHALISDASVSLQSLAEMCQPGYAWGGSVVTL